jgi:serine/threonine protein kinase
MFLMQEYDLTMTTRTLLAICLLLLRTQAFQPDQRKNKSFVKRSANEWKGDFEDYFDDGQDDTLMISNLFPQATRLEDRSGAQVRQFLLGQDLILSNYAGSMGFDEVTDWEYYRQDEDGNDRQAVQPNPMDPSQPKRTRASSGSVVRVFRGEFVGTLGASMRAQGLDRRVLVKEFTGQLALDLARAEWMSMGKLQSKLVDKGADWIQAASSRSVLARTDNQNIITLCQKLIKSPYLGILGEVNLAELEGSMEPNDFYRALGVPPPKPNAIWIVYEYAGLTTLQSYCVPPAIRRASMPLKRGFFGYESQPPLPRFPDRARYVKAIMKQLIIALADLHEAGIAHKSIGRSSILMSSTEMDKLVASSVFTTNPSQLVVKLADFGFSTELGVFDSELQGRARTFGISIKTPDDASPFMQAEDLHAMGFVFVGLLLTVLADLETPDMKMPATDEDSIQRLLGDIFDKDLEQFRDYLDAEEGIWCNVVEWLDEEKGWSVLEGLWLARETVAEGKPTTARDLLQLPFFQ